MKGQGEVDDVACVWMWSGWGDPPETEIATSYGISEIVSNLCEKIQLDPVQLDLGLPRCVWDIPSPLETISRKIP